MRLAIILLFLSNLAFSQANKQQIAYKYYMSGQYDKASVIYKEIAKKNLSVNIYSPYFSSLISLEKFLSAEKLAKKMFLKYPKSLNYQADVIVCQSKRNSLKSSKYNLSKLHKKLSGNQSQTIRVANIFLKNKMYNQAIEIYLTATKINNQFDYGLQKAQLYSLTGDDEQMIIQYLEVLEIRPDKKQIVFSNIQKFLYNNGIKSNESYDLVKKNLLRYVNKLPSRIDFNEMLVWFFMQNKKYKLALFHAISIDKRTNDNLGKVYDLSENFLDKKRFTIALEALDYIISKGSKTQFYIDANINKLYALSLKYTNRPADLEKLDKNYLNVISSLGKNKNTVVLLSNYAHFKAFYLKDLFSAKTILEETMLLPGIDNFDLAECKIEYADVMLLSNNIWDALLFYSQVEKDFKEHPIGHLAKFKRAKIAYYQGDFSWCQAQLDVLKSSTSKLVANDAMELSLLISDNYDLDTTEAPMLAFARGDLALFQNKFLLSLNIYDSILHNFNGHQLSDEIYYRKSNIFQSLSLLDSAVNMLSIIINEYDYEILADDALFDLANIYQFDLFNDKIAMNYYEQLILNFQGSIFASESRERFRLLRGDNLNLNE